LASGDPRYFELPRSVIDVVAGQARTDERGRVVVPHRHGDNGWYDYRPITPTHLVYLWQLSQAQEDYKRMQALTETNAWDTLSYQKGKGDWEHARFWLGFIEGRNPGYPVEILQATYAESLRRLDRIRKDRTTPDEQDVHHWQNRNPVVLEGLVQTMLAAPNHVYHGGLLHCRLFYFDPVRRRPGLPPDVAVLVDRVTTEGVSLVVINLHPSSPRTVIVQAGAFGEHAFTRVQQGTQSLDVGGRWFRIDMRPGCVGRIDAGMKRFANRPAYGLPW
jgi:hypothetical protein